MKITTDCEPVRLVASLEPGQCVELDIEYLELHLQSFTHNGHRFTSADRVLENIIGSSYELSYSETFDGKVRFYRLDKPLPEGQRAYVSPDRRR
ncbi:hypothetical protein [Vibrio atlanticus]|uniref:Uncharacterized protein n=1 Tax=Vibrio atlanticus TaxID=693153 RepID=A0ABV4KPM6_9VIBR